MGIKKVLVGWMNDFGVYEQLFEDDGVTHADLYKHDPMVSEIADELKRVGLKYTKVRVTIEEL